MWRRTVLPGATEDWCARPVVGCGVVALGCSWDEPARGRVPVLAVHDIDGSPGFVLGYEAVGAWSVQTSEPAIAGDIVRAAVYEHDCELVVVAAFTDGTELPRTSLGGAYPLHAADSGAKLVTRIAGCGDDGFVVSWAYRQVREYFTGKFRDGTPEPVWSAKEWLAATTAEAVLGYTRPQYARDAHRLDPHGAQLVARDPRDGRVRWERDSSFVDVAGVLDDAFVLVDRATRYAELRARERSIDEAFFAGRITDEELRVQVERDVWPTTAGVVRIVDAVTGHETASFELAGEVISACASDGIVSAIGCDQDARGELVTWHAAGEPVRRMAVPIPVRRAWPPEHVTPVIVGHAGGDAVWAEVDALHARRVITLPHAIRGMHPRVMDRRLAKPNALVAHGHVYARQGDSLWISPTE